MAERRQSFGPKELASGNRFLGVGSSTPEDGTEQQNFFQRAWSWLKEQDAALGKANGEFATAVDQHLSSSYGPAATQVTNAVTAVDNFLADGQTQSSNLIGSAVEFVKRPDSMGRLATSVDQALSDTTGPAVTAATGTVGPVVTTAIGAIGAGIGNLATAVADKTSTTLDQMAENRQKFKRMNMPSVTVDASESSKNVEQNANLVAPVEVATVASAESASIQTAAAVTATEPSEPSATGASEQDKSPVAPAVDTKSASAATKGSEATSKAAAVDFKGLSKRGTREVAQLQQNMNVYAKEAGIAIDLGNYGAHDPANPKGKRDGVDGVRDKFTNASIQKIAKHLGVDPKDVTANLLQTKTAELSAHKAVAAASHERAGDKSALNTHGDEPITFGNLGDGKFVLSANGFAEVANVSAKLENSGVGGSTHVAENGAPTSARGHAATKERQVSTRLG